MHRSVFSSVRPDGFGDKRCHLRVWTTISIAATLTTRIAASTLTATASGTPATTPW